MKWFQISADTAKSCPCAAPQSKCAACPDFNFKSNNNDYRFKSSIERRLILSLYLSLDAKIGFDKFTGSTERVVYMLRMADKGNKLNFKVIILAFFYLLINDKRELCATC